MKRSTDAGTGEVLAGLGLMMEPEAAEMVVVAAGLEEAI